jgi:hypothetical protein
LDRNHAVQQPDIAQSEQSRQAAEGELPRCSQKSSAGYFTILWLHFSDSVKNKLAFLAESVMMLFEKVKP